jgi:hypothetical protein
MPQLFLRQIRKFYHFSPQTDHIEPIGFCFHQLIFYCYLNRIFAIRPYVFNFAIQPIKNLTK